MNKFPHIAKSFLEFTLFAVSLLLIFVITPLLELLVLRIFNTQSLWDLLMIPPAIMVGMILFWPFTLVWWVIISGLILVIILIRHLIKYYEVQDKIIKNKAEKRNSETNLNLIQKTAETDSSILDWKSPIIKLGICFVIIMIIFIISGAFIK